MAFHLHHKEWEWSNHSGIFSFSTVGEDPVRVRVRNQRHRLPGHVLPAQPDEHDGRFLRLRGQRPGLLPPPHDPPVQLRGPLLSTVSTRAGRKPRRRPHPLPEGPILCCVAPSLQRIRGDGVDSGHHRLVQPLRFKNLHFGAGDGRAAAAGCLPLRTPLRSLCAHFCILKKNKTKKR